MAMNLIAAGLVMAVGVGSSLLPGDYVVEAFVPEVHEAASKKFLGVARKLDRDIQKLKVEDEKTIQMTVQVEAFHKTRSQMAKLDTFQKKVLVQRIAVPPPDPVRLKQEDDLQFNFK